MRGKAGLSIGSLVAVLSATKSQIFGYNHDLQVDKEAMFSAVKDCELSLMAVEAMMATATFNIDTCERSLNDQPLLLATDITELMVSKGTPFRIAYKAVAVCIRRAVENNLTGKELCDYLKTDDLIGDAAREVFGEGMDISGAMKRSVQRRSTRGGTSTGQVESSIAAMRDVINNK